MKRRSNATTYNLISLIFLVLAVFICLISSAWVSERLAVPEFLQPATDIPIPELQVRVSFTPSNTPISTSTPFPTATSTFTLTYTSTVTKTTTPSPTVPTSTPTLTQSPTPSSTFTPTFTPTETATVTWTPSATGVTPSPTSTAAPFPFDVVDLRVRPDLNEACNFQGVAGNVFDLFNEPLDGLRITVTGSGLPQGGITALSGSNANYGPGGWEARVSNVIGAGSYSVQLFNSDGTPLSKSIDVSFGGSCSANLVLVSYRQVRPF